MANAFELPSGIRLQYFAEGGANIVYRILTTPPRPSTPPIEADLHAVPRADSTSTPPPSSISPTECPTLGASQDEPSLFADPLTTTPPPLLRLRKDLPYLPVVVDQHTHYTRTIAPLFPDNLLLPQTLALLPPNITDALNTALRTAENAGTRPSTRHGTYLPATVSEPHGLLVADISPHSTSELTIELKPKWLAQSPTAPQNAMRCRTCALRAMRANASHTSSTSANKPKPGICPLDLISNHHPSLTHAIDILLTNHTQDLSTHPNATVLKGTILAYLHNSPILPRLRDLQARLDPHGVLALPLYSTSSRASEVSVEALDDFLTATAVRDCTLYLRVGGLGGARKGGVEVLDARLGDLDLKIPDVGKVAHWRGVEEGLVEGGWYVGRDGGGVGCALERGVVDGEDGDS